MRIAPILIGGGNLCVVPMLRVPFFHGWLTQRRGGREVDYKPFPMCLECLGTSIASQGSALRCWISPVQPFGVLDDPDTNREFIQVQAL